MDGQIDRQTDTDGQWAVAEPESLLFSCPKHQKGRPRGNSTSARHASTGIFSGIKDSLSNSHFSRG